jgi:hypothetical protein
MQLEDFLKPTPDGWVEVPDYSPFKHSSRMATFKKDNCAVAFSVEGLNDNKQYLHISISHLTEILTENAILNVLKSFLGEEAEFAQSPEDIEAGKIYGIKKLLSLSSARHFGKIGPCFNYTVVKEA